jgi:hypothetical protein
MSPSTESSDETLLLRGKPDHHHRTLSSTFTHYRISTTDQRNAITTPSRLDIEIIHPKPSTEVWYSVTIVSRGKYTGTAVNLGPQTSPVSEEGGSDNQPITTLLYQWSPPFRGDYEIIVHELPQFSNGNEPTIPFEISQITVEDVPGLDSYREYMARFQSLPSCSSVRKPGLYTRWNGDWIGPELSHLLTTTSGLRTGWTFVPSKEMNCHLDYFTDADLSSIPTTTAHPNSKSIYIIGTSKERGVFLSLIDMMLQSSEKTYLESSVISKCWGRAFVNKSNLRVLYQDWRSNFFEPPGSSPNVICHDDKVVREGGSTFVENGHKVWEEIFDENHPEEWPSVILMSVGTAAGFEGEYDLERFIRELPPGWEGTLFLTDGTFSARDAGRGTMREFEDYRGKLMALTKGPLFDRRVHWLDGMGVSKEMRMYAEDGPDHVSRSQHFHGSCDLKYGNGDDEENRMMICSNVTEMVAQLMLNHALGPKDHFVNEVNQLERMAEPRSRHSEMTYCHACPADMLPFHITPYPDMTCARGSLHERTQNEIKKRTVPQTCPDDCLTLKVERFVPTQSGVVHERVCPMDVFLPALEGGRGRAVLMAQEEEVPLQSLVQLYPFMLAVFATVVMRLFFRGRVESPVANLVSFVQTQVSKDKNLVN